MKISKEMEELCECAWQQGFGEMAKASPGVFCPSIPNKIRKRLEEIETQFHGKVKA